VTDSWEKKKHTQRGGRGRTRRKLAGSDGRCGEGGRRIALPWDNCNIYPKGGGPCQKWDSEKRKVRRRSRCGTNDAKKYVGPGFYFGGVRRPGGCNWGCRRAGEAKLTWAGEVIIFDPGCGRVAQRCIRSNLGETNRVDIKMS